MYPYKHRCHSITVLASLSISLSGFHNLSFSLNQSAIEWAQGMICQNSSEMEIRDVHWIHHAETCCNCCYRLFRIIEWGSCSFFYFRPPFGLYSVWPILDEHRQVCNSHTLWKRNTCDKVQAPQTQRWMYIHILVLLSLGGCSADSIYSIYFNGFACFSPFTANMFLTSFPWVVTDFRTAQKKICKDLKQALQYLTQHELIFIFLNLFKSLLHGDAIAGRIYFVVFVGALKYMSKCTWYFRAIQSFKGNFLIAKLNCLLLHLCLDSVTKTKCGQLNVHCDGLLVSSKSLQVDLHVVLA